jgi:hypothetical protein
MGIVLMAPMFGKRWGGVKLEAVANHPFAMFRQERKSGEPMLPRQQFTTKRCKSENSHSPKDSM